MLIAGANREELNAILWHTIIINKILHLTPIRFLCNVYYSYDISTSLIITYVLFDNVFIHISYVVVIVPILDCTTWYIVILSNT